MLLNYIQAALKHAKYEILPDDGKYYGEIPECNGTNRNNNFPLIISSYLQLD